MATSNDTQRITRVPTTAGDRLNERQRIDYEQERDAYISWMRHIGKDPDAAEGYAEATVKRRAFDHNRFCTWVWDEEERYTLDLTHDHAEAYCRELAYSDYSATITSTSRRR